MPPVLNSGVNGGAPFLVVQSAANTTALVTASFTPATGDVLVVKGVAADAGMTWGTPTGGGWTYTNRVNIGTAANTTRVAIWTAPVGAGGTAMTVSLTPAGLSNWHSMVVEVWSSAQLAASPAVASTNAGSGAPTQALTTAAPGSVVSWCNGDWAAVSPASRTFRDAPTDEGVHDGSTTQYVAYYAYQAAASAGSQTFGLTAPTGQTYSIAGIEIQAAAGAAAGDEGPQTVPMFLPALTYDPLMQAAVFPMRPWQRRFQWATQPWLNTDDVASAVANAPAAEATATAAALDAVAGVAANAAAAAGTGAASDVVPPYRAAVAADSPVAWWRLDETTGTTAADSTGTNTGTYTGSPTLGSTGLAVADPGDKSVTFSASTLQYVEAPDASALNPASLSIEALIDPTTLTGGNHRIVEKGADSQWQIIANGTTLQWNVIGRTALSTPFTDTGRHHVVCTYDSASGVAWIYVDGRPVATTIATSPGSAPTTTTPLRIAGKPTGVTASDGFPGQVEHVALYSSALSPMQVKAHADAAVLVPGQVWWKGELWDLANRGVFSPFVNSFSGSRAWVDDSGYLHLSIVNNGGASAGAELGSVLLGRGYGTYQCLTGSRVDNLHPNAVFGGLFTYDGSSPDYGHREIDANEQSMFSGATGPCQLSHTHWQSDVIGDPTATTRVGYNAAAGINAPSDSLNLSVLVWEPGKVSYRLYHGATADPAQLYREDTVSNGQTITTGSFTGPAVIPIPGNEKVQFNLWVCPNYSGTSDPATVTNTDVIIRDFSFSPAGVANATGAAPDAVAAVGVNAATATGTGTAPAHVPAVGANAAEATATGSAADATVSAAGSVNAPAGLASATGAGQDAAVAVAVNATEAAAAGSAPFDTSGGSTSLELIQDNPVDATGTAYDATVSTTNATNAPAGSTTAVGTAYDATVALTVPAAEAVGTGSANAATASAGAVLAEAVGTGAAPDATVAIAVNTTEAAAAGVANDATVSTASQTNAPAAEAVATGTAPDALAAVGVNAGTTTATGVAFDATVSTAAVTNAAAENTLATGAANDPTIAVTVPAALAAASGTADNAAGTPGRDAPAGAPSGTAAALDPIIVITVQAQAAAAAAAALDATGAAVAAFTVGALTATTVPMAGLTATSAPTAVLTGTVSSGGPA